MGYFFPVFFILFLIFIVWLNFERKKSEQAEQQKRDSFWQRENEANSVRRQSLDNLPYITIPDWMLLPELSHNLPDDEELKRCDKILKSLQSERILNLTGKTATDLKFAYGAANLQQLDEYDQNFTLFARTIYAYGQQLHNLGFDHEAIKVLRFGIDSLSDISGNYKLLATLYMKYNQAEKIQELKTTASSLDSMMKSSILKFLNDLCDSEKTHQS